VFVDERIAINVPIQIITTNDVLLFAKTKLMEEL